jgi:uncharacterized protein YndB with AHSA1/START domain
MFTLIEQESKMTTKPRVERSIAIGAARDVVFRFFTDTARWASWWGAGSTIDARPGGQLLIRYPDGTQAAGEVIEVVVPERLAFSYGFVNGQPFPAGGSRVTIRLEAEGAGTRVHLEHELPDEALHESFVQGWRYQLALFSNTVCNEVNADAAAVVDEWFAAWRETDPAACRRRLDRIAVPALRYRDRFSATDGVEDLVPHVAASRRFMPDMRMERRGGVRHCQGTALVDWVALAGDGTERAAGTNAFVFAADGRIESVTGFWRT